MTPSSELSALRARLRAVESSTEGMSNSVTTNWYRNPDGPAAADAIESLLADLETMQAALECAIPRNVCLTNRNVPDSTVVPIDATMGDLRRMAAALQTRKAKP